MTIAIAIGAVAQENQQEDPFKVKPTVTLMPNFYSGLGNVNDDRGFGLDRTYLGFEGSVSKEVSFKAVIDCGKSSDISDYQRIMYIKNAYFTWKHNSFSLTGGLQSTLMFKTQEKFWGKRYVMKSLQDEYKFGSSADLGVSGDYKFGDIFKIDLGVFNGEGYKKLQTNDGLCYATGLTLTPIKGLTIRAYGEINEAEADTLENVNVINAFCGYQNDKFSIGAEADFLTNYKNTEDKDRTAYSFYASVKAGSANIFARADLLESKDDFNIKSDGNYYIAGVEFNAGKYIKLAPNVRFYDPKDSDNQDLTTYVYLNAQFAF